MSERTKNFALLFAVLLVFDFSAAQIYNRLAPLFEPAREPVRTLSPLYHHDLLKSLDGWAHWGHTRYSFRTNNLGFRDERVREVALRSDATRVLLLGDSFTEGVALPFPQTFAGMLARDLRPQGVEVLNAAAVSYSPTIYYRKGRWLIEMLGLDVDVLVVLIDISDILDEAWLDRYGRARVTLVQTEKEVRAERLRDVIRENSVIAKLASRARRMIRRRLREGGRADLSLNQEETAWDFDPNAYRDVGERGLRRASAEMDSLLALARRHDIPLAVVVYPWPDEIFRQRLNSRQVVFWRAWAEERGVPFVDLFPRFITGRDPESTIREYYIPYDFHWSEAGHRLVADALLDGGLNDLIAEARRGSEGQ